MEDSSEDLPKPPRRTAARPFFSPRPNSGEGVSGALDLSRRRAAQLFTPPGSSPGAPLVNKTAADHVGSRLRNPQPHPHRTPKWISRATGRPRRGSRPIARSKMIRCLPALDHGGRRSLVVELFEHEEIELNAAPSDVADEHSIEVIAYDDANSLLKAAARDGKHPRVDGLQLETTEFSFEQEAPPPRMSVDSFWESEPFANGRSEVAGDTSPRRQRQTRPNRRSTRRQRPSRCAMPSVSAPMLADIAPPWRNRLTPVSSQALEELKESEPWDLTPSDAAGARSLEESSEAECAALADDAGGAMRRRPRASTLRMRSCALRRGCATESSRCPPSADMSDEAALSVVLTSLLRTRR